MSSNHEFITLTDENFKQEVLDNQGFVLVDVWAAWCGPCRLIAPIVEELATDFAGRINVGKLNVDHYTQIASRYGVSAIPTLLIFKDGQVVDQFIGVVSKSAIASKLDALLNGSRSEAA